MQESRLGLVAVCGEHRVEYARAFTKTCRCTTLKTVSLLVILIPAVVYDGIQHQADYNLLYSAAFHGCKASCTNSFFLNDRCES